MTAAAWDLLRAMRSTYAAFAADRSRKTDLRVMAVNVVQDLDAVIAAGAVAMACRSAETETEGGRA